MAKLCEVIKEVNTRKDKRKSSKRKGSSTTEHCNKKLRIIELEKLVT